MSETVSDFIVRRLHDWGVRHIFGYPGDGINGVFGALNRADGRIEFIQARHEEMAAFMASAYAKFSGRLGSALRRLVPEPRILRPVSMTRCWTTSRSSRWSVSKRVMRLAANISRSSTLSRCSRT